jgi:predicted enzyme related to lactoylglutathione lyase
LQLRGIMAMVMVRDIERALRFYRDLLGFTVDSEQEDIVTFHEGVGLQAAPDVTADLRFDPNAVLIALYVDDVQATFMELTRKGVAFFLPPTTEGGITFAAFRDTENNLLQLMQNE